MNDAMWTWEWAVPVEASFGDNPFFDWVRVATVALSGFLMMTIARILVEQGRRKVGLLFHQKLGFSFSILAALSIALTEMTVFGTPATPRLIVSITVLAFGIVAMMLTRRFQRTLPIRKDR